MGKATIPLGRLHEKFPWKRCAKTHTSTCYGDDSPSQVQKIVEYFKFGTNLNKIYNIRMSQILSNGDNTKHVVFCNILSRERKSS